MRHTGLLLPMLIWIGCGGSASGPQPGQAIKASESAGTLDRRTPIQAVATIGMVADLVRHVGQQHVDLTQLLGAGVDPHLYKATRDDVQTILSGEIVFYSGPHAGGEDV